MKKVFKTAVKLTAAAAVVAGATAANAAVDFGKRGEKVDLVSVISPTTRSLGLVLLTTAKPY